MSPTSMPDPSPHVSFWPPQIKQTAIIHVLLVAIYAAAISLFVSGMNGLYFENDLIGGDFINLWTAANLALNHQIMTLFDIGGYYAYQQQLFSHALDFHNWSYPIHLVPWVMPLGFVPYVAALVLWLVITFALYAFAAAYKRPQAGILALILLLAPASYENIIAGQNGFLSAACMIAGLRLLGKRPVLSGIAFGFLTFKPQLGLLVPVLLIAGRHWKALGATIATAAALIGISIAFFGIDPWLAYFNIVMPYQTSLLELPPITSFAGMVPTPFMTARFVGASLTVAYSIAAIFTVLMVAVVAYAFRKPMPEERRNAIMLTAMFLATPYGVTYDMTSLSAAVIAVLAAQQGRNLSLPATTLLVAVWLLPLCLFMLNAHDVPVGPFVLTGFLVWQLLQWRQIQAQNASSTPK